MQARFKTMRTYFSITASKATVCASCQSLLIIARPERVAIQRVMWQFKEQERMANARVLLWNL